MHAIFKVRNEGKKGLNKSFPLTVNGTLLVMPVCPSISLVCTYIRLFVISLQRYIQQSKQLLQLFNSRIDCNHRQQKIDRVHGRELQLKMIALLFALLFYHSTTDVSCNEFLICVMKKTNKNDMINDQIIKLRILDT